MDQTISSNTVNSKRYVVFRTTDNVVVNAIAWDGVTKYVAPAGCSVAQSDTCLIGQVYEATSTHTDASPTISAS